MLRLSTEFYVKLAHSQCVDVVAIRRIATVGTIVRKHMCTPRVVVW